MNYLPAVRLLTPVRKLVRHRNMGWLLLSQGGQEHIRFPRDLRQFTKSTTNNLNERRKCHQASAEIGPMCFYFLVVEREKEKGNRRAQGEGAHQMKTNQERYSLPGN